ncbi:TetR/AcrR family transcriptional regulator [Amycolatopsis sp. 195334CR]|uniref:TetR/AcrR family transcriptional regulator n=1 Tax=Amycolatopsis sp. 195334CR TaxID=2814588 RepID=UPI001A8D890A|nr:TetR/AcrR family transcriptional regulator [Amycolatopsis sp. 195334CR]MBN6039035.1 TetR/AcrR family transcriptional regulator [Amycolatopsis sp. 195334CR]
MEQQPDDGKRAPGRPRSREADEAILSAAVDLLVDQGMRATNIEQVAQRAGVTRRTVYRRFPDLTALLVRAIEWEYRDVAAESLHLPDVEAMLTDWAAYLSQPRARLLIRRLYGTVDELPDLLRTYHEVHGRHRSEAVRTALDKARADGRLPQAADTKVLQEMLSGAALQHLAAYPDNTGADEIEAYFLAILRQIGYQPPARKGTP